VQLGCLWTAAIGAELPFHATYNDSTWKCNQGFFRTTPSDSRLATCKRCSSNILNASHCPSDTAFIECTPLRDAECLPCGPLPSNAWVYAPDRHDCRTIECNEGYFNNTLASPSVCSPCASGSYCSKGERKLCGDNLTTLSTEEASPLGCIPEKIEAAWQFQLIFYFSLTVSQESAIAFCATPKDLISGWLNYGKLIDCTGSSSQTDDNMAYYDGMIKCILITSQRYAEEHMNWLYTETERRKSQLIKFAQTCIERDDISSWTVYIAGSRPDFFLTNVSNAVDGKSSARVPIDAPEFTTRFHVYWGGDGHDIAAFVTAIAVLTSGLCASIGLLAVGIVLRFRRKRLRNATHTMQMSYVRGLL
jgi:hypothetical protein